MSRVPDPTPPPRGVAGAFPTTHWTFVTSLQDANEEEYRKLLNTFLLRYFPAFRTYIEHKYRGLTPDDHEDILQEFVASNMLRRRILERDIQPPLRRFLMHALNLTAANYHKAKKRHDAASTDDHPEAVDAAHEATAIDQFDAQWARQLLNNAVDKLREEFSSDLRQDYWMVFDTFFYQPNFTGTPRPAMKDIADQLGVDTRHAYNMFETSRRHLSEHLHALIREYAMTEEEVQEELRDLKRILQGPPSEPTEPPSSGS